MSGRAQAVLGRFPAHLEAPRPGKQLERVVEGLVAPLDLLSAELAAVRRAHRLPHADTLRDVMRIGALHGLSAGELALLFRRAERTRELAAELEAAVAGGGAAARDAAAGALRDLWGVQPVPEGVPPLAPFASPAAVPDLDEAARRAARAFRAAAGFRATVEGARRRVERVSQLHAAGNGTVRAVLEGAAAALDLELDLPRNLEAKEEARPDVVVQPAGGEGRTAWGYVVVARSITRSDPAVSLPAFTAKGPAQLTAEDAVRVAWAPVPDVLDYLVFRVHAGGAPASTGLLTATPLPAEATSFDDVGDAAGVALPPPVADDGIFHSRDLFWHSTYVRDRVRPLRRLDPEPPPRSVAMGHDVGLQELAEGVDVPFAELLARLPALEGTLGAVDAVLDAATAREAAQRLGGRGEGVPETASAVASRLGATRRAVYLAVAAAVADEVPVALRLARGAAEVLAAEHGFAVVQPGRIGVFDGMTGADLARRAARPRADVAALPGANPDPFAPLRLDRARALARALDRDAFEETPLLIGETVTAGELAGRMGVLVSDALRQLAVLGVADPQADTPLDAETAARLAAWRGHAVEQPLPALPDLLGIEENPLRREGATEADAKEWYTGERFTVLRRGFGRVRLRAAVIGVGKKTVGPMLVNRDEGHGVAWAGTVPDGETLVFAEDGHVRLQGRDVTSQAWAWKGACFAGSDDSPVRPRDFVFAGPGADPARTATFAVSTPGGAFDPGFPLPHAGLPLPMPGVGLGETRFAFFVHEAHFAARDEAADHTTLPVPRQETGFFDTTVFAGGGATAPPTPAARIALSWEEHEAYAVRLLIPARFRALYPDEPEGEGALARVEQALERHRPAGVDVRVEYLEDRWVLGGGALGGATPDPLLGLRGGTELWPLPDTP